MRENKNIEIELLRFLGAWIVVGFHFYAETSEHFIGGFFSVDFFLILAGIMMFIKYKQEKSHGKVMRPYQYLWYRFSRVFPGIFVGFVLALIVRRGIYQPVESFVEFIDLFAHDIWELLLVDLSGMNTMPKTFVNGPAWTISSMLIAQFVIWGALYYFEDKFLNYFMPFSLIIGFAMWANVESTVVRTWLGFTTFGTLRAYLVICLGYYCALCASRLSKIQLNGGGRVLLTVAEYSTLCVLLIIEMFRKDRNYWFCSILLNFIVIAFAMSGQSYINKLLSKKMAIAKLGNIGYSIYLSHGSVHLIFIKLFLDPYIRYSYKWVFIIAVLLAAVIHGLITAGVITAFRFSIPKFRKAILASH